MSVEQTPVSPKKDRYTNTVSLFVVIIGIIGIAVYPYLASTNSVASFVSISSEKIKRLTLPNKSLAQVGGDVVVPPPIEPPKLPVLVGELVSSSQFTAKAMVVKDVETGSVLYSYDEYEPLAMASITKLMSALIVLEKAPDWTTSTVVVADNLIDTHMYAGDTYTLQQLWEAALVGSSNKAIMTLADAVGWPREAFVARMNERARELGMGETQFVEPTGLSSENVSSASDIAMLLSEALTHPEIATTLLKKEVTMYSTERQKKHHMWSTNWLLLGWVSNNFTLIGGKTGYIPESGYNFTVRLKDDKGHEIDVVVLGASTHEARFVETKKIANAVFSNFQWPGDEKKADVVSEEAGMDTTVIQPLEFEVLP